MNAKHLETLTETLTALRPLHTRIVAVAKELDSAYYDQSGEWRWSAEGDAASEELNSIEEIVNHLDDSIEELRQFVFLLSDNPDFAEVMSEDYGPVAPLPTSTAEQGRHLCHTTSAWRPSLPVPETAGGRLNLSGAISLRHSLPGGITMAKFVAKIAMTYYFDVEADNEEDAAAHIWEQLDGYPRPIIDYTSSDNKPIVSILTKDEYDDLSI